jgi:hypothetical protein
MVIVCYFTYLVWSYLKLQFQNEPDFTDVANKVDIIIAVCMGALLKLAYGMGSTLREISGVLPRELSARFDSLFVLNKDLERAVTELRTATSREPTLSYPPDQPYPILIPGIAETVTESIDSARDEVHVVTLPDGRRVEIRIPRVQDNPLRE